MRSGVDYVESLTPWPDEFGLERMRALLERLGNPQLAFPAIHVVGTNGKTTTTRMIEALLLAEGLAGGCTTSPHVTTWSERIRVNGEEVDFERAIEAVRDAAEEVGATQFEVVIAAALAEFARARVDAAAVEAGLGGRLDATNVLRSPVQVLTNVALEHTDVLGSTREAIAAEKLAVVQSGSTVVLGEPEWEALARRNGARTVVVVSRSNAALAVAAVEAFLGRSVDAAPTAAVALPGRLERRGERPLEIWDGAHNVAGLGYMLPRLPAARYVVVASFLRDAEGMLAALSAVGDRLVATRSSNPRALTADEVAETGSRYFAHTEAVPDPVEALTRARELADSDGAVLVTGSLYLLRDLNEGAWQASARS